MQGRKLTVSIVAYNSKNVLQKCIGSILDTSKGIDIEVVIVDNCSQDGSAAFVRNHFPGVRLIENNENVGFGKAHNQSFRISQGEYFLILNPDTVIFPNAIKNMIEFMDSHENAGVVGCKLYWDDDKKFMFPDLRIHSLKTAFIHFTPFCQYFPNSAFSRWYWNTAHVLWDTKKPIIVDGITGGLMLFRREAFESAGCFDENFFLFFEEHDLLRRIKKHGWKIYYLPDAEIQHFFEESFRNSSIDIGSIYMKSAFYYYKRHYGVPGLFFIRLLMIFNNFILTHARNSIKETGIFKKVYPSNKTLFVNWPSVNKAERYLVEISYSPSFCDRGGMFIYGNSLLLESKILDRLPFRTGFLRILPVYRNNSTGKVIQVIKITDRQNEKFNLQ